MMTDRSRLEDRVYRQYASRFGSTMDPTVLPGRAWNAARILMRKALEEGGPAVTTEMIQQFAQTALPQYKYCAIPFRYGNEVQLMSAPAGNWLFPEAEKLYACYLKACGQTFSSHWLIHKEWQVLLMCVAGIGSEKTIVNITNLPIITNEIIQSYMRIVNRITAGKCEGEFT